MTVALSDLVPSLKRSLSAPGTDNYADALSTDWVGSLADAFYDCRLRGLFADVYLDTDEMEIDPLSSNGSDPSPEMLRLIVLYAALNTVRTALLNAGGNTMTRFKAGPAEAETQKSAQLLKQLFQSMLDDLDSLMAILTSSNAAPMSVFNGLRVRDAALYYGYYDWVN